MHSAVEGFVPTIEEAVAPSGGHRQFAPTEPAGFVPTIEEAVAPSGGHRQFAPAEPPEPQS